MRRRWPILAATVPLLVGWSLTAAFPAAAAPAGPGTGVTGPGGPVQPGGPVSDLGSPTVTPQVTTGTPDITSGTPRVSTGSLQNGGAGPSAGGGRRYSTVVTSSNWSGYAAISSTTQFTSVSASWVQPAGNCSSGNQYAAFWVGLDGYSSSTVEQTGSEVDCVGRTPRYYGWYEMYPGASSDYSNTVKAGDHFTASVTYTGSNQFVLVLSDTTRGWTQTQTQTLAGAARSSAEVIAEAPCCTARGGILPLTNFGTVNFTGAKAGTSTNTAGASLATYNPVEITMPDVSVSSLSSAGNFSVSYTGAGSRLPFPFGGF
jgi:Peptidase A4 family